MPIGLIKMKKQIKQFIFILFFSLFAIVQYAHGRVVLSESMPILFKDADIRVYEDTSNQADYLNVLGKLDYFVTPTDIKTFKPYVSYWVVQKIVNELNQDRELQIDHSGWRELTAYVIDSKGNASMLKSAGFVGNHNPFLAANPGVTKISEFQSQFPSFILKKGEEVTILTSVKFHPVFPSKSFSFNFYDKSTFSEFRRFSLYLEGLLLGTLFALTIFAVFNAYHSNDRVNIHYAIWITTAFFSVSSLHIIDGHRLFEFFFNVENYVFPWSDTIAYVIFIVLAFGQSISYIIFARQYLNIKKYFPKIQIITNVWIAYAVMYGFLAATGEFYKEDTFFSAAIIAPTYSIAVGGILLTLFVCSYLRYRAGFGFAIFFTYAVIPYLVFRLSFLFGIIGISSPFQMLPDYGIGYFLKNPWTNQAFGVCMEAMIMALAVISRARWLQNELTISAENHSELIKKQNQILETTVEDRTRELRIKHELVLSSVNYASRLQRGQLPRSIRIDNRFSSFDTIWEPRDVIGGDVYWVSSSLHPGPFILAVADSTGHGVPGAMLSLLVSNSLERIYANDTEQDPATALLSLDRYVRLGLNQDRADSESDDGCDAAVLRINPDQKILEFSGAKLGLFRVTDQGFLTRYSGARCSLGYQEPILAKYQPYLTTINYDSGDVFVITTDGLTDQIGGPDSRLSYGYRRLEILLKSHYKKDVKQITEIIKNDFAAWQGSNVRRDDVTVVVFKL